MKIRQKIFLNFLFFALIIILSLIFISYKISRAFLENSIQEHLLSVAKNKATWIDTYFSEKKADIFTLTECPGIKDVFKQKIESDISSARNNLRITLSDAAKGIENFVSENPSGSFSELNKNFRYPLTLNSNMVIYEKQTDTIYFHSNEQFLYNDLMYFHEHLTDKAMVGEYSYINDRGITKDRVIMAQPISMNIPEKMFFCAVSNDVDYSSNYVLSPEREDYLIDFINSYNFENLMLFTWDGQLLWSCKNKKMMRANLSLKHFQDTLISKVYEKVHKSEKLVVTDVSFCSDISSVNPLIFIGAPVYMGERQDPLGIITVQLNISMINEIMQDRTGLGNTGETYIVGSDFMMRSDSRFFNESTILKTKVVTDATSYFFSNPEKTDINNNYFIKNDYKDYRGIHVLGCGLYLPDLNWLVLAEIDVKEALYPLRNLLKTLCWASLIIIFLIVLVSIHSTHILTKPIVNLKKGVDIIQKGDIDYKVDNLSNDEIGELTAAFNKMNNIRKRNEKELEDNQRSLSALINNIPGIAYRGVHDKNRSMNFISSGCYELTGYTKEEVNSKDFSFRKIINPDDQDDVWNTIDAALKKGNSFEVVYRIFTKTGKTKWLWEKGTGAFSSNSIIELEGLIIDITDRKNIQNTLDKYGEKLEKTKIALEQKNILLSELLEQVEAEKSKIKEEILTNINKFILPTLDKLKQQGDNLDVKYIDILNDSLKNITSSMGLEITKSPTQKLSPREIEICNMIKSGLSTKEISNSLNISSKTVERYRNNIRKKLNLVKKKVNLVTYLHEIS